MTYTNAEIIAAARAAVEEYGADYVYDPGPTYRCHYAEADGSPSCLIGHVVKRLDPELFAKIAANHALNYETAANSLTGFGISYGQGQALYSAQLIQDSGRTWGIALDTIEAKFS